MRGHGFQLESYGGHGRGSAAICDGARGWQLHEVRMRGMSHRRALHTRTQPVPDRGVSMTLVNDGAANGLATAAPTPALILHSPVTPSGHASSVGDRPAPLLCFGRSHTHPRSPPCSHCGLRTRALIRAHVPWGIRSVSLAPRAHSERQRQRETRSCRNSDRGTPTPRADRRAQTLAAALRARDSQTLVLPPRCAAVAPKVPITDQGRTRPQPRRDGAAQQPRHATAAIRRSLETTDGCSLTTSTREGDYDVYPPAGHC